MTTISDVFGKAKAEGRSLLVGCMPAATRRTDVCERWRIHQPELNADT